MNDTLAELAYRARNAPSIFKFLKTKAGVLVARKCGVASIYGELSAVHFRRLPYADGFFTRNLGILSTRSVTNAGVTYMRDDFNAATGAADITNFKYHDCGTGVVAENVTDTALGTAYGGSRATGSQTTGGSNIYSTVGTISFTGTLAITEHGLFSATSTGTLWDRSVFAAINVVNGDSIQFTYNLTITAGG